MEIQEMLSTESGGSNGGGRSSGEKKLDSPFGFPLASEVRRQFIVTIDPTVAQYVLQHMHPRQRTVVREHVEKHLAKMRAGAFVELMQPGIYFDRTGWCCNANHRLIAQVEAQMTYRWNMVIGASPEEIAALDQNRPRRPYQSHNLTGAGDKMTSREEAMIRQYIRLQQSDDDALSDYVIRIDPDDLTAFRAGPFSKDVSYVLTTVPTRVANAPSLAAIAYARPIDVDAIDEFLRGFVQSRLALPTSLSRNAAAVTLARWFNTNRGSGAGQRYVDNVLIKTLSALRAHLQDREISYLQNTGAPLGYLKMRREALGIDG